MSSKQDEPHISWNDAELEHFAKLARVTQPEPTVALIDAVTPKPEWKTWLRHLDFLDGVAILIFLAGILGAIYALLLRHR